MKFESLGTPCRNFCFFQREHIPCDPYDGKEKIVLATFVAGGTGRIYFLDTENYTGEDLEIPGDWGSWALLYLPEHECLLVGTCPEFGYLHRLDLKTRTWAEPLRIEGEPYIWTLAAAKDGNVYCGTWGTGTILKYDPRNHTLVNLGKPEDDNPKNQYTRICLTAPDGNIIFSVCFAENRLYHLDVETGKFTKFGEVGCGLGYECIWRNRFVMTGNADYHLLYDAVTLELAAKIDKKTLSTEGITDPDILAYVEYVKNPPYADLVPTGAYKYPTTLKDGRFFGLIGAEGQEYFILNPETKEIRCSRIPCEPPPTEILGLAEDEEGTIWFSTGLGQTIGWYNPADGSYDNTSPVTAIGGEVYQIVPYDHKLWMVAYSGGDHIVYDPKKPWNQYDNVNPLTLESIHHVSCRPNACNLLGPDNNIWAGWSGTYGNYGGTISRINTKTNKVDFWHQLVPLQTHGNLAASSKWIYSTTNGSTSGLDPRKDEFYLLRHDPEDAKIVWSEKFALGMHPGKIAISGGKLFMALHDEKTQFLYVYDEETMEKLSVIEIGKFEEKKNTNRICGLAKYDDNHMLVVVDCEARLYDTETLSVSSSCALECNPHKALIVAHDKWIYYGHHTTLYRFRFDD